MANAQNEVEASTLLPPCVSRPSQKLRRKWCSWLVNYILNFSLHLLSHIFAKKLLLICILLRIKKSRLYFFRQFFFEFFSLNDKKLPVKVSRRSYNGHEGSITLLSVWILSLELNMCQPYLFPTINTWSLDRDQHPTVTCNVWRHTFDFCMLTEVPRRNTEIST